MSILDKLRKKRKSGESLKVVPVEEIKKEAVPEIDGYARIAEFQKTGIPYFLRLTRSGSKQGVANIDIHSFQVIQLRDMIAEKFGGDTYVGNLVDIDMKSVLLKGTNKEETYIFRIDGPPPKVEKPKSERQARPDPITADKVKEILTVVGGFLGPALMYLIKMMESKGDMGEKTLSMAKELMQLTAGPSIQEMIAMITGVVEGTTKIQSLAHPTPPITTGDGAGALGQTGLLGQLISGIGAGLAPAIQGMMAAGGNSKPAIAGQTPPAIAGGSGPQPQQQGPLSGTQTEQGTQTPIAVLPPPDIAGKLLEMANRNEATYVIAEQIVTLLDAYRRSTNPVYPQFAHYLENTEMAFDTLVKIFPVLTAWPGRESDLRQAVYEICAQIQEQEREEEDELHADNSKTGSDPDRQGAGLFDQTPIRFPADAAEAEPLEPEPEEDTLDRSTESVVQDENEDPDGEEHRGSGPVHSEVDQGETGEAE